MILTTSIDHCLLPKRDERKRKKNFVHAKALRRKGRREGKVFFVLRSSFFVLRLCSMRSFAANDPTVVSRRLTAFWSFWDGSSRFTAAFAAALVLLIRRTCTIESWSKLQACDSMHSNNNSTANSLWVPPQ